MLYHVPQRLIDVVCRHVVRYYLPPKRQRRKRSPDFNEHDLQFFAKGAGLLSEAFTRERSSLPQNYLNLKEFRSGYILYFTITNYLKSLFCLNELSAKELFKNGADILDIGSGPGTSLLAALDHFHPFTPTLTAIDQNPGILKDASLIMQTYSNKEPSYNSHPPLNPLPSQPEADQPQAEREGKIGFEMSSRLKTICARVSPRNLGHLLGHAAFHIIFLSNFLSEIRSLEERTRLVSLLVERHLRPSGSLIIIEPAIQKTARDLMILRDDLLAHSGGGVYVLSPCLHELPCPMLAANRRDWCHMYLDWERPVLIEKLDRIIGNRRDYLKFAYLILAPTDTKVVNDSIWRVVSAPLRSNGKTEILVCNKRGLVRLVLLDRDRNKQNLLFDHLERGDLIEYGGTERLGKESSIRKVSRHPPLDHPQASSYRPAGRR